MVELVAPAARTRASAARSSTSKSMRICIGNAGPARSAAGDPGRSGSQQPSLDRRPGLVEERDLATRDPGVERSQIARSASPVVLVAFGRAQHRRTRAHDITTCRHRPARRAAPRRRRARGRRHQAPRHPEARVVPDPPALLEGGQGRQRAADRCRSRLLRLPRHLPGDHRGRAALRAALRPGAGGRPGRPDRHGAAELGAGPARRADEDPDDDRPAEPRHRADRRRAGCAVERVGWHGQPHQGGQHHLRRGRRPRLRQEQGPVAGHDPRRDRLRRGGHRADRRPAGGGRGARAPARARGRRPGGPVARASSSR